MATFNIDITKFRLDGNAFTQINSARIFTGATNIKGNDLVCIGQGRFVITTNGRNIVFIKTKSQSGIWTSHITKLKLLPLVPSTYGAGIAFNGENLLVMIYILVGGSDTWPVLEYNLDWKLLRNLGNLLAGVTPTIASGLTWDGKHYVGLDTTNDTMRKKDLSTNSLVRTVDISAFSNGPCFLTFDDNIYNSPKTGGCNCRWNGNGNILLDLPTSSGIGQTISGAAYDGKYYYRLTTQQTA